MSTYAVLLYHGLLAHLSHLPCYVVICPQDKLLAAEELHEVFAAPTAHPMVEQQQGQMQKQSKQQPHKLQGHKSGRKLFKRAPSSKRAAGRPVVTVIAGSEVGEVSPGAAAV